MEAGRCSNEGTLSILEKFSWQNRKEHAVVPPYLCGTFYNCSGYLKPHTALNHQCFPILHTYDKTLLIQNNSNNKTTKIIYSNRSFFCCYCLFACMFLRLNLGPALKWCVRLCWFPMGSLTLFEAWMGHGGGRWKKQKVGWEWELDFAVLWEKPLLLVT